MRALEIREVSPRDGLQSLNSVFSVEERFYLCSRLIEAGFSKIEVGSLVKEQKVPAMAKSDELFAKIREKYPNAEPWLLVPNEVGLRRALELGARYLAFFTATSATFQRKNTGQEIEQSLKMIEQMAAQARNEGVVKLRLYVSTIFHCAYEGEKKPTHDLAAMEAYFDLFDEISLADTTGRGKPNQMEELLLWLSSKNYQSRIFWHFHDTYGHSPQLIELALEAGYYCYDSSFAGVGGCPFMPGARGNVDTRTVLKVAEKMGISHGYDWEKIEKTYKDLREKFPSIPWG
ncbi:MAG: hypothetical protein NZM25_00960 [Leptospiraceae bacterium]|nr:hypothetical protein [Leptospiraceae bacterium]MDW8306293.1 hypothetical protein [Leptospiraceae bacterium]